jgi:hypothetical protein
MEVVMTEKQPTQPIQTIQVECPRCVPETKWVPQTGSRAVIEAQSRRISAAQEEARIRKEKLEAKRKGVQWEPQPQPRQRYFPLVIAMQPDGTLITRAFCHRRDTYCRGCAYEQGTWIDTPKEAR